MKRVVFVVTALAALLALSCEKPGPVEEQKPETELKNCILVKGAQGEVLKQVELRSTVGFVSDAGMYSIYASDARNLTKELLVNGYSFTAKNNVIAVSSLFSLLGTKVDITKEMMHWMMSVQLSEFCSYDLLEGDLEEDVVGGYFVFNVDVEKEVCSLEVSLDLKDGSSIWCQSEGIYTPGGENETLFEWNEMSRPVRAAFYDNSATGSNPPLMYFTSGQIEYGADIPRTTYARILPSASICDGQPHDIAGAIKAGQLEFMIRDFDSEWNVVSGTISIKHIQAFEYEVLVSGAEGEDRNRELGDRAFRMVFSGELKDIHIERQIENKFEMGLNVYQIKSCVVDLRGEVAAIYMAQTEGITTAEAAKEAKPLIINFSSAKFGTSIGLSTDKANFAVTYGINRWDAQNLDTGSFICHEYNPETGLLHCQVANLCLSSNYSTVLKMEYKGTPVYLR